MIETLIYGSAWAVIASLVLIFVFIGKEALPLFFSAHVREEIDFFRLFSPPYIWQPVGAVPKYSFIPLIIGTLKVTLVSLVVAIPISLGAAIFTSEFAPPQLREWIKPVIELLAGIPSVVLGFFCLLVLASWMQDMFHFTFRLNAVTAGIGLGLAVIPIVYTVAEDALSAVPQSFREASMAMGASSWQTAWKVVFPAAFPGIFAACVLGFGRAIGETMIVLMASGNAAITSWTATDSLRTFSATIAAELAEVVVGSAHYHILFFIGVFLLTFTFLINILAHWFVKRLQGRLEGNVR